MALIDRFDIVKHAEGRRHDLLVHKELKLVRAENGERYIQINTGPEHDRVNQSIQLSREAASQLLKAIAEHLVEDTGN